VPNVTAYVCGCVWLVRSGEGRGANPKRVKGTRGVVVNGARTSGSVGSLLGSLECGGFGALRTCGLITRVAIARWYITGTYFVGSTSSNKHPQESRWNCHKREEFQVAR
jgi:hypothetical protein